MKRVAILIAVLMSLGFLTTIVIAWTLAIRTDVSGAPRLNTRTGLGTLGYYSPGDSVAWIFTSVQYGGLLELSASNRGHLRELAVDRMVDEREVPAWSTMRRGDPTGATNAFYIEQGFGWPALAMAQRYRYTRDESGSQQIDVNALHLPPDLRRFGPGEYVPIRLIWKGAAINSALFGWIYFCLLAFPGIVVRARRARRGRCGSCGYDLRATPRGRCPECGSAIVNSA